MRAKARNLYPWVFLPVDGKLDHLHKHKYYPLTFILFHYEDYCAAIYRNAGINCYWVINNAQSVLHSIQTLNSTFAARELDTFGFSTLYTSISHHSLKVNMKRLLEEAFKVRDAHYLSLTRKGKCFWSTHNKYDINLSLPQLVGMVDYLSTSLKDKTLAYWSID